MTCASLRVGNYENEDIYFDDYFIVAYIQQKDNSHCFNYVMMTTRRWFQVGIEAWKSTRDSTGSTPEDYARLRGHYSYIHLVQRKINKRPTSEHVVVDVPPSVANESSRNQKQNNELMRSSLEIGRVRPALMDNRGQCKVCDRKVRYGSSSRSLLYRPAMLSMVAIAAVCVCVALLFKSSPEVVYIFRPFRWELLEYGTS